VDSVAVAAASVVVAVVAAAVAAATAAVAVAAVVAGNRAGSIDAGLNPTGAPGIVRLRLFVCTPWPS
jgi:hypothetical protein